MYSMGDMMSMIFYMPPRGTFPPPERRDNAGIPVPVRGWTGDGDGSDRADQGAYAARVAITSRYSDGMATDGPADVFPATASACRSSASAACPASSSAPNALCTGP